MTPAEQKAAERRMTEIGIMFRACWNTYIIFYTVFLTFSITAIGLVGGWIVTNSGKLDCRQILLIRIIAGLFMLRSLLATVTSINLAFYSRKAGVAYDSLEQELTTIEVIESKRSDFIPSNILKSNRPVPVKLATYAGWANASAMAIKTCVWFCTGFLLTD